jgi:RNA polymerase sigma factor (sigma-70 family)
MVRNRASKYRRTRLGYDDACGEGYLSLVESALRYDDSLGVPFSAYACRKFCWAMTSAHRKIGNRRRVVTAEEVPVEPRFFDGFESRDGSRTALIDLSSSFGCLSPRQVAAAAMALHGYKQSEIADVLGVTQAAVSYIFTGLRDRVLNAA